MNRLALLALSLASALVLLACPWGDEGGQEEQSRAAPPDAADGPSAGAGAPDQPQDAHARTPSPKLIILLSIDTLRADHLGFLGYEKFTSPVLDGFAAEGVVFEDASATSPWTLPSHASMLTGLFPLSHRVLTMATRLPDEIPTLASLLKREGYRTAAVVNSTWLKQDNYGLTRDFEKYFWVDAPDDRRSPNTWVTDQATEWIDERGEERLFLFVHYYDVHSNYASLPHYEKLFVTPYDGEADGSAWQLQLANFEDDYIALCTANYDPEKCRFGGPGGPRKIDGSIEKIRFNGDDIRHMEELYDAGIRQFDSEIGRLFNFLERRKLMDETLFVITSDHGEEFMEHGRVDHFLTQYQEMLHVPLVLRGPGIPRGMRISTPVSLVDIVPTVLRLAKAKSAEATDGLDLVPLVQEATDDRRFRERYLYGEASGGLTFNFIVQEDIYPVFRSLRSGSHKLIHDSKARSYKLYDIIADPLEKVDISSRERGVTARLKTAMQKRYADYTATPDEGNQAEPNQDDGDRLRALGYIP